ncbi:hypothetical protein G4B88_029559, partial [Cannabis sativa]
GHGIQKSLEVLRPNSKEKAKGLTTFHLLKDHQQALQGCSTREMDPGRYGLQQGWDNNSLILFNPQALEGYGAVHEPNFRIGGSYVDRRGGRKDGNWRRRESRDRERDQSPYKRHDRERDHSPCRRHERSRSRGRDDNGHTRSRSPRGRSHGRSHREDSSDDARHERLKGLRGDVTVKRSVSAPSATVVVKGLSQKTTEEDLYQILAEWGPLSCSSYKGAKLWHITGLLLLISLLWELHVLLMES